MRSTASSSRSRPLFSRTISLCNGHRHLSKYCSSSRSTLTTDSSVADARIAVSGESFRRCSSSSGRLRFWGDDMRPRGRSRRRSERPIRDARAGLLARHRLWDRVDHRQTPSLKASRSSEPPVWAYPEVRAMRPRHHRTRQTSGGRKKPCTSDQFYRRNMTNQASLPWPSQGRVVFHRRTCQTRC